jgi:hypothetical protein
MNKLVYNVEGTKYNWSWNMDQRAIIESGLNIDDRDYSIFKYLARFASSLSCKKLQEEEQIFYYFHWTLIKNQFPVFKLNTRQSVNKRILKLIDAELLIRHEENQRQKKSWYRFGKNRELLLGEECKRKLPSVNESYPKEEKTANQCKPKLPSVNESYEECKPKLPFSVNESLHNTTTINNTTINNIDISKEVKGILPNIPQDWPDSLKIAAVEYLAYRQELKTKDQITSQRSWNAKINSFTKLFKEYGEEDTVGAINLSISSQWKKISMQWFLDQKPSKTKNLVIDVEEDKKILTEKLEGQFQKGLKDFNIKFNGRILYFSRSEFLSWLPDGKNFEKHRQKFLPNQIFKKIKDMILILHTNTFYKNSTGHLHDFIKLAFQGKIRELA